MALAPTQLISTPYEDYAGYWLKFYTQGTTTPITMAIDAAASSTVAKAEISSGGTVPIGFIKTTGDVIFIPYVDEAYDAWLFPTEAEADSNTTTNAVQVANDVFLDTYVNLVIGSSIVSTKNFTTLAVAIASTTISDGDALNVAERSTGNAGGAMWDVVLSSTVTENTFNIVQCTGVATLSLVLRIENGVANVKEFGATGDGSTDDQAAIVAAIAHFTTNQGGAIYFPIGVYKCSASLSLAKNGLRVYGECWRGSILWYSGTTTAIAINNAAACEIDHIHITSLDPATANHLVSTGAGTGTAEIGIELKHVDSKIHHCTISYFNDVTLKAAAIKTVSADNCFSNSINHNYIRFCWGGVELRDVVTDTDVIDNSILDVTKYGVSLGYNWKTATQTTFVGDNFRIHNNLIQQVNKISPLGDGIGIYLATGSVIGIKGNYIEDVESEVGSTAYGIFANGVTANKLIMLTINDNNLVTNASVGSSRAIQLDNLTYVNAQGNHMESGAPSVNATVDATFINFGVNFFTGAPATAYSFSGASSYYLDLATNNGMAGSRFDFHNEVLFRNVYRGVVATFANLDATPSVAGGCNFNTFTNALTITDFDGGSGGQTIRVLSKGAITYDTTGTDLTGSSADIVTAAGDYTEWYTDDGTTWVLTAFVDVSANNSGGA